MNQIISIKDVAALLGVSVGTVRKLMRDEGFPQPVQISPRRVGIRYVEINAWISGR